MIEFRILWIVGMIVNLIFTLLFLGRDKDGFSLVYPILTICFGVMIFI